MRVEKPLPQITHDFLENTNAEGEYLGGQFQVACLPAFKKQPRTLSKKRTTGVN
jgi:hypothetical protein